MNTVDIINYFIALILDGKYVFYAIQISIYIIVFYSLILLWHLIKDKMIARKSKPFSRSGMSGANILIIGDSTAIGTGAEKPEDSIAGRFGHDYPNANITNLGKNGAHTKDVLKQLEKVEDQKFDMVIVSVGGNDIWSTSSMRKVGKYLEKVLDQAKEISGHRVLLFLYLNMGSAPFFSFPTSFFLQRRAKKILAKFSDVAFRKKVPCIDLFTESTENNPFLRQRSKYFAEDLIHPSSEGYKLWYNRMWFIMNKYGYSFDIKK